MIFVVYVFYVILNIYVSQKFTFISLTAICVCAVELF